MEWYQPYISTADLSVGDYFHYQVSQPSSSRKVRCLTLWKILLVGARAKQSAAADGTGEIRSGSADRGVEKGKSGGDHQHFWKLLPIV